MITKVQKWGNSQGLRFPKPLLKEAHIQVGDEVSITVQDGKITVQPVRQRRHRRVRIEDLVHRMPADYQVVEINWGDPVGKEAW